MSAQRARSAVQTGHRSIHPNIPGVPSWGAVLIAMTATAVGYAIDAGSGHKELTHVFAAFYIGGCLAAVLAVRQAAVFTAVIQPPLILFFAVPGAYWLFHRSKIDKLKDLLINCGYPLIERFPLMLGTAGVVLLIGLFRWYFGMTHRTGAVAKSTDDTAGAGTTPRSAVSGVVTKLRSLWADFSDDSSDEAQTTEPPPAHAKGHRPSTRRTARGSRPDERPARTRSRHTRPPAEDKHQPRGERPRRHHDVDPSDPPRRRGRPAGPPTDPNLGMQPPRHVRRDPQRRGPYERPAPRRGRFDPNETHERPQNYGPAQRFNPYERYGAAHEPPYEPYQPPYEPSGRHATSWPDNPNPGHHPISQVRYRKSPPQEERRDTYRDEPRNERSQNRRSRPRTPRRPQPESWDYDD
ncbi:DUF6542 domain-containing protein [Mycobacterium spongiae]|uniref:DUF6542 domain-containing protein n=1 Tax=Mycobacterium spongiae TaxID=886343 RepID=A0A975PXU3_9MYCO|nr:DUF6542 domain-containing protein [Mycobacterium spongiae]QUR68621.1 hypothetical protein F6B93_17400 [Mycobacterium spongiae]